MRFQSRYQDFHGAAKLLAVAMRNQFGAAKKVDGHCRSRSPALRTSLDVFVERATGCLVLNGPENGQDLQRL